MTSLWVKDELLGSHCVWCGKQLPLKYIPRFCGANCRNRYWYEIHRAIPKRIKRIEKEIAYVEDLRRRMQEQLDEMRVVVSSMTRRYKVGARK